MMFYRVSFEFRLTRNVLWASDGTDFYAHVEEVVDKLKTHGLVSDLRAITHLADSSLILDFALESAGSHDVIDDALNIVRDAIEACGGRHFGMASAAAYRLVGSGAGPGPNTPVWQKRRLLVDVAA